MKEVKLLTTELLSHHFVEPICAKLLARDPEFKFSILAATIDREPDVDMYLLPYEHKFDEFINEELTESKLHLWASSLYLERKGVPKTLDDLLSHTVIRPERTAVALAFGVRRFGTVKHYAPYYHKKECIKVDGLSSVFNLAEAGVGIVAATSFGVATAKMHLEKIPSIEGDVDCYRKFTLGYHKKHKDDPRVQSVAKELKCLMSEVHYEV